MNVSSPHHEYPAVFPPMHGGAALPAMSPPALSPTDYFSNRPAVASIPFPHRSNPALSPPKPPWSTPSPQRSSPSPGLPHRPKPLTITVSDPQTRDEPRALGLPGLGKKYITYSVTTEATAAARAFPTGYTTVRRRFSDFVLLDAVLKMTHRGYFIPPRPLKYAGKFTGKLKSDFVRRRCHSIELYLQRLGNHPVVSQSAELRIFLTTHEELREAAPWRELNPPSPNVLSGAQRLLKQVTGRQGIIPSPQEAAASTSSSHDVVRSVRETVFSIQHKSAGNDTSLPELELQLRQRSEFVRALITTIGTTAHTAVRSQRSLAARIHAHESLGSAFSRQSAFEEKAAHMDLAMVQAGLGSACLDAADASYALLAPSTQAVRALEEQARSLGGVLAALRSREEALVTMQSLQAHLAHKRARAESLQVQQTPRAVKAIQELADAEAAETAAKVAYEQVARRNEEDMRDVVSKQARDTMVLAYSWVHALEAHASREADVWLSVAHRLGVDRASIDELHRM